LALRVAPCLNRACISRDQLSELAALEEENTKAAADLRQAVAGAGARTIVQRCLPPPAICPTTTDSAFTTPSQSKHWKRTASQCASWRIRCTSKAKACKPRARAGLKRSVTTSDPRNLARQHLSGVVPNALSSSAQQPSTDQNGFADVRSEQCHIHPFQVRPSPTKSAGPRTGSHGLCGVCGFTMTCSNCGDSNVGKKHHHHRWHKVDRRALVAPARTAYYTACYTARTAPHSAAGHSLIPGRGRRWRRRRRMRRGVPERSDALQAVQRSCKLQVALHGGNGLADLLGDWRTSRSGRAACGVGGILQ
jgi:hypothetical protein